MTSEILNHFQSDLQCSVPRPQSVTDPRQSHLSRFPSAAPFRPLAGSPALCPGNSRDVCGTSGALLTRENPEQRKDDEPGGRFVPTGAAVTSRLTPAGRGLFDMCGEMRR